MPQVAARPPQLLVIDHELCDQPRRCHPSSPHQSRRASDGHPQARKKYFQDGGFTIAADRVRVQARSGWIGYEAEPTSPASTSFIPVQGPFAAQRLQSAHSREVATGPTAPSTQSCREPVPPICACTPSSADLGSGDRRHPCGDAPKECDARSDHGQDHRSAKLFAHSLARINDA